MRKQLLIIFFSISLLSCSPEDQYGIRVSNGPIDIALLPKMISIPATTFTMGTDAPQKYWNEARPGYEERSTPTHVVELSPYEMAQTLITVKLYKLFLIDAKKSPRIKSYFQDQYLLKNSEYGELSELIVNENSPIVLIDWNESILFCNWLSLKCSLKPCYIIKKIPKTKISYHEQMIVEWDRTANGFRLPTEAEYEYILRDGGKDNDTLQRLYQWTYAVKEGTHRLLEADKGFRNSMGFIFLAREFQWNHYGLYNGEKRKDPIGPDYEIDKNGRMMRSFEYDGKMRSFFVRSAGITTGASGDVSIRVARSAF